jgi:hypothetical protein
MVIRYSAMFDLARQPTGCPAICAAQVLTM